MTKEKPGPGGRPRKFQTAEDLQAAIDAYFDKCDAMNTPYTIGGLCLALGTSRQLMHAWENDYPEYFYIIKAAKARVEEFVERLLLNGGGSGAIFWLKNQGWTDRSEVETSHTFTQMGDIKIGDGQQSVKKLVFNVGTGKKATDDDEDSD